MLAIKLLTAADLSCLKQIRQQALEEEPQAYGQTLIEFFEQGDAYAFEAENGVVGAFDGDRLLGMLGFYVKNSEKQRHKLYLWGLYVAGESRGQGIGRSLIHYVGAFVAKDSIRQILVHVIVPNEALLGFYNSCGFELMSSESDAYFFEGKSWEQVLLVRPVVASAAKQLGIP
ncbi:MAG: GNAT family N-acetyltransferase [Legionella sp.]|jgi:ribosomal protein S18 acetylase RimI-like enzyme